MKYTYELVMTDKNGKRRSYVTNQPDRLETFWHNNRPKARIIRKRGVDRVAK